MPASGAWCLTETGGPCGGGCEAAEPCPSRVCQRVPVLALDTVPTWRVQRASELPWGQWG